MLQQSLKNPPLLPYTLPNHTPSVQDSAKSPPLMYKLRLWPHAPAATAALLACLVYLITLHGTYIYDDVAFIEHEPRLHQIDQWPLLWTQPYHRGADILYRPLTSLSFALQFALHGDQLWALHLVNILLHAGVTALIAELALTLATPAAGWIAGLLFAVHPVHVEAVAGLVGRSELLCALGILGALQLWLHRPMTLRRMLAILALFALAALSKEQGTLLPFILLAALPWRGWGTRASRERNLVMTTLALTMFGFAAYILWRENHPAIRIEWDPSWITWSVNAIAQATGPDRWLLPIIVAGRYTALLAAPFWPSLDYGGHVIGATAHLTNPYLWIGLTALLTLATCTLIALLKRRFALLLLLLALAMSYGLISNFILIIGTIMGERLMYLPSAFFLILATIALCRLPSKATLLITLLLIGAWSWRTFSYAALWNDPQALYQYQLTAHPDSSRGYRLVAQQQFHDGHIQAAWQTLDHGLTRLSDDLDFWLYAIRLAYAQKDFTRAVQLLDHAEQAEHTRQNKLGIHRKLSFEELDNWRGIIRDAPASP